MFIPSPDSTVEKEKPELSLPSAMAFAIEADRDAENASSTNNFFILLYPFHIVMRT